MIGKISILSPHFDDAAYALTLHISGIIKSGIPLTVINCFTVTSWTAFPVDAKGRKEISLMREHEDVAFYSQFNTPVTFVNLNLLDAPLRNEYIFQYKQLEPDEWMLVKELRERLQDHIDGLVLCPLAIGNHIDQQSFNFTILAKSYFSRICLTLPEFLNGILNYTLQTWEKE